MGQVHFFTGVKRRRRWSDDQKRAIVVAAFAPGAVVSEVARRAEVSTGLIYRWRNDLRPSISGFAPVVVSPALPRAQAAAPEALASNSQALVATLKLEIEKLRRQLFGTRSERTARLLEQYELQVEELEAAATEDELAAEQAAARATTVKAFTRRKVSRKPFPEHPPAVEGDPDGAGKVHLPRLRGDHPAAGTVPYRAARLGRAEPAGHDPL